MGKVTYFYTERKKSESGQTGSVIYDLPNNGFIPWIELRCFSTPTASTNPALPLNKAITKVELIDGGMTIMSLSANQIMGSYMHRVTRKHVSSELNDNAVEGYESFRLQLGQKVNGVEYAPDFSRFKHPQIRITFDYSITTGPFGETFDADATPSMKFTVLCKKVVGTTKYTHGYIRSSEIKTFAQTTSTENRIDIPLGKKMFGIMIEAGYVNLDFTEDVNELKLDFNSGEYVPLDLKTEELAMIQNEWFGPANVSFMMDLIDGKNVDVHMGFVNSIVGTGIGSTNVTLGFESTHQGINQFSMFDTATPTAISTYELVYLNVHGVMPYNCFYIPASKLNDGEGDLIDTGRYNDITLVLKSGSSASTSSTPSIIFEELVTV